MANPGEGGTSPDGAPSRPAAKPIDVSLQLLLVRSMLDRATESSRDVSDIGCMSAILLLDATMETLVKTACTEIGEEVKSDELHPHLEKLAQHSERIRLSRELAAVKRLRKARNPVQHGASTHTHTYVRRLIEHCEAFATLIVREIFHEDFAAVSVVDLVRDPQARTVLELAAVARKAEHWSDGLLWACLAFENLCGRWEQANRRALGLYPFPFAVVAAESTNIQRFMRARVPGSVLLPTFPLLSAGERLPLLMMGFSPSELASIFDLIRRVESEITVLPWSTERVVTASREEVDFVIETVARQAWRLEAAHPGLFGEDAYRVYVAFVTDNSRVPNATPLALPGTLGT